MNMVGLTSCWTRAKARLSAPGLQQKHGQTDSLLDGQKRSCQHRACSKNMVGLTTCWTRAKARLSALGLQQEHDWTYKLLDKGKSVVVSTGLAARTWSDLHAVGQG